MHPLRISVEDLGRRADEVSAGNRFSDDDWNAICIHLSISSGDEAAYNLRAEIEYLCAKAAQMRAQDENGPSRGERMAALIEFSGLAYATMALAREIDGF